MQHYQVLRSFTASNGAYLPASNKHHSRDDLLMLGIADPEIANLIITRRIEATLLIGRKDEQDAVHTVKDYNGDVKPLYTNRIHDKVTDDPRTWIKIPCPYCYGSGRVPTISGPQDCGNCYGKKEVMADPRAFRVIL